MRKFRDAIDGIDRFIVQLLAIRNSIVAQIAQNKLEDELPVRDSLREAQIILNVRQNAEKQGLDPDMVENVFRLIIDNSAARQQIFVEQFRGRRV